MTFSVTILWVFIAALAYLLAPYSLVVGWIKCAQRPKLRSLPALLSFTGFILSTASAALALAGIAYAQVHHFKFYDPGLMRIERWGLLLSFGGLLLALGGLWSKHSLRLLSPASAVGTLAFWLMASASE